MIKPQIEITESFHLTYPDAAVGVMLVEEITSWQTNPEMEEIRHSIEASIKSKFSSKDDLIHDAIISAYSSYYKKFKKNYHVLFQLESVISNKRSLPPTSSLVQVMFMAELDNMLLTAGHNLTAVEMPLSIGLAQGTESYTLMNGIQQTPQPNDMCMADRRGIISSVIYGPDHRTRLTPTTQSAMFVVYLPPSLSANLISKHMTDIFRYIQLCSPAARMLALEIY